MSDLDDVVSEFKNGFDVVAEKERLLQELSRVQTSLEFITNFEGSVDQFVAGIRSIYGASLTADILLHNLQAKFGGGNVKRKRAVKSETSVDDDNHGEIYQKVLSVMTKEPMTFSEISKFLGEELPRPKISEVLLSAIKKGEVDSDGKYKGKRYFLTDAPS